MIVKFRRSGKIATLTGLVLWFSVGMSVTHAAEPKPTIVDLINNLKSDSLRRQNGKWLQTWVEDPGFDDDGPAKVDIPNGYAVFADTGTGAGSVRHEFAVYYPEGKGAILVYYYENDMDTYRSELKFYQLNNGRLETIAGLLPPVTCRDLASPVTLKRFYQLPQIANAGDIGILPTYQLPRKGTAISAYCDTTKNRFSIEAALSLNEKLTHDEKAAITNVLDFSTWIEFAWNKKQGAFAAGKRHRRK